MAYFLPLGLVVSAWLAIVAFRWNFLADASAMLSCSSCLLRQSLIPEAQFALGLLALHGLANWLGRPVFGALVRLCLVLLVLVSAVDAIVLKYFLVRFNWHELLKFAGEKEAAMDFLRMTATKPYWLIVWAGATLPIAWGFAAYVAKGRAARPLGSHFWTLPLFGGMALTPSTAVNFHTPYIVSAPQAFIASQPRFADYPHGFDVPEATTPADGADCVSAQGRRAPIVLVIVESLSAYHSRAWSGLNDWTPQLDRLMHDGRSFINFFANGTSTEDGLIALLTGEPPIPKPERTTIFRQFSAVKETVPRVLNELGYHTTFLTTGNLGFLDKGIWLKSIGFAEAEGHDYPGYRGLPRFHFDAATDDALYDRTLRWMEANEGNPFFLMLETVSSHQPYVDPSTGIKSIELAFRYADAALGRFVTALRRTGYLDRGYLVVMGDHRAMVPVSKAESERYGDRAYSRVPLLLLGPDVGEERVEQQLSQTDLLPSLKAWLGSGTVCLGPNQGTFLTRPGREPRCIFTRRPYDPDRVAVQCGKDDHAVLLDGAATRYLSLPKGDDALIRQIHRLRLGRGW